jgi:hypothetical protein
MTIALNQTVEFLQKENADQRAEILYLKEQIECANL